MSTKMSVVIRVGLFRTLAVLSVLSTCSGKICLKNEDIGRREGNMYQCDDPDYQRCCEVDETFTCCVPRSDTVMRDQLTIWGVIAVLIAAISVTIFCFRKDIYCFESDTLKQSIRTMCTFSRKRRYKPTEDKRDLLESRGSNTIANLGEPDAREYVQNYLISETGAIQFTQKPY